MSNSLAANFRFILSVVIGFCVILFCLNDNTEAASLVSGRYLSDSGTEIILNLSIQNPAPANLIVEQYLSAGNTIIDTDPKAKKVDAAQGNAKWLFLNTRSGSQTLTIRLREPLNGRVNAIVRYRSPNDGSFTELRITP